MVWRTEFTDLFFIAVLYEGPKIMGIQYCPLGTEMSPDSRNLLILCTEDDDMFKVFAILW